MLFRSRVEAYFKSLQNTICLALEETDGKARFQEDIWTRPEGGGGKTRIIQEGNIIEKGGVNFSAVEGKLPQNIADALKLVAANFFATGVSIVIHPNQPHVPIIHMNVRYFETMDADGNPLVSWFGGGIDLTPHYVDEKQAGWFHQELKNTCDEFDLAYYPKFKKWADDYFFIQHRKETRGVGGIFFDRLSETPSCSMVQLFSFVQAVGNVFAPIYTHLMRINHGKKFTPEEKQWQLLRRGRYVEFNLVYDKGTKFGLDTNGRIESILMSLPNMASWIYNFPVNANSNEAKTLSLLQKEINWIAK